MTPYEQHLALEAKRKYQREYYQKNKQRHHDTQMRYWLKKAKQEQEQEAANA